MQAIFEYFCPPSLDEMFRLLSQYGDDALLYAGGTDILVLLRAGKLRAKVLIDTKAIPELKGIMETEDSISIGAACCFTEIETHPLVRQWAGALCKAASMVGSVQIRNKGTLAGNIQTASPAGDGLNAAWGLDATIRLMSPAGERSVLLTDYVQARGLTARRADEVIARIDIPKQDWTYQQFFKVGRRNALAISVLNGVVALKADLSGRITAARVSLGSVAPTPLRIPQAEGFIIGSTADKAVAACAAEIVQASVQTNLINRARGDYRIHIAGVMVKRQIISFGEEMAH